MSTFRDILLSGNIIISLVVAAVTVAIIILLGKFRKRTVKTYSSLQDPKVTVIRRIIIAARVLISVMAVLVICQINGINISSAIAGLGIMSAIVGLALQDYLKDVIMGVHIISDRFFSVGDCVEYGGKTGIVLELSLTCTKIGDLSDHSVTTICNRNITEMKRIRDRFYLDIPVPYGESPKRIHGIFEDLCKLLSGIPDINECKFLGTQDFDKSAVMQRIMIFCEPQKAPEIRRQAFYNVQCYLADQGIEIPFEQLDVHIDKE